MTSAASRLAAFVRFASSMLFAAATIAAAPAFGSTVTNTNDSGPGSLRDAILNASPGETIDFAVTGTITLASPLTVGTDLLIHGPGAQQLAVSGNSATRVFDIALATQVTISGLTIENGLALGPPAAAGANGANGGPDADGGPGLIGDFSDGQGGGIFNKGVLTIDECSFVGNRAQGGIAGAGGKGGDGGAASQTINGGRGGDGGQGGRADAQGGAVYIEGGPVIITNSAFSNNIAAGGTGGNGGAGGKGGDGLGNGHGGRGGDGQVGDGADGSGGAIYNVQSELTIVNCTFDGNQGIGGVAGNGGIGGNGGNAPTGEFPGTGGDGGNGGFGGDLDSVGAIEGSGTISISQSTIARNNGALGTAGSGGNGGAGGAGVPPGSNGVPGQPGSVFSIAGYLSTQKNAGQVDTTILALPVGGPNCGSGQDFTSGGNNLSFPPSDTSCDLDLNQSSDRIGQDPQLGTLALNAPGTTPTDAIGFSSAARDAITPGGCLQARDQRGVTRPQGSACDIGAYELQVSAIPTLGGGALALFAAMLVLAALTVLRSRA